jgi:hypothetical protein
VLETFGSSRISLEEGDDEDFESEVVRTRNDSSLQLSSSGSEWEEDDAISETESEDTIGSSERSLTSGCRMRMCFLKSLPKLVD